MTVRRPGPTGQENEPVAPYRPAARDRQRAPRTGPPAVVVARAGIRVFAGRHLAPAVVGRAGIPVPADRHRSAPAVASRGASLAFPDTISGE